MLKSVDAPLKVNVTNLCCCRCRWLFFNTVQHIKVRLLTVKYNKRQGTALLYVEMFRLIAYVNGAPPMDLIGSSTVFVHVLNTGNETIHRLHLVNETYKRGWCLRGSIPVALLFSFLETKFKNLFFGLRDWLANPTFMMRAFGVLLVACLVIVTYGKSPVSFTVFVCLLAFKLLVLVRFFWLLLKLSVLILRVISLLFKKHFDILGYFGARSCVIFRRFYMREVVCANSV